MQQLFAKCHSMEMNVISHDVLYLHGSKKVPSGELLFLQFLNSKVKKIYQLAWAWGKQFPFRYNLRKVPLSSLR